MSQQNVEIVRRFIDAYNRRDLEGMIEVMDPTFEFRSHFVGLEFVHHASDPKTYFEALDDAYDQLQLVLDEYIDAGAAVLAAGRVEWRGKASGARGDTAVLPAFWLRAGKVLRAATFTDRAEALEAVGLSEPDAQADS
jgi:ketosteroid isomerase-like protein